MIAYKLLRVRANGTLGPLFINAKQVIPIGEWLKAGCYPTNGFAVRPGWHCAVNPVAPHLGTKGRAWYQVEIKDFTVHVRPECQGGRWLLANWMRVVAPVPVEQWGQPVEQPVQGELTYS